MERGVWRADLKSFEPGVAGRAWGGLMPSCGRLDEEVGTWARDELERLNGFLSAGYEL